MKTIFFSFSCIAILSACAERNIPHSAADGGFEDALPTEPELGPTRDQLVLKKDVSRGDVAPLDIEKADTLIRDIGPDIPCTYPQHSDDCAQVSNFQCGFNAICQGNTVIASWHEHVFCPGQEWEEIINYSCSYDCPGACLNTMDWPMTGTELVAKYCTTGSDSGPIDAGAQMD